MAPCEDSVLSKGLSVILQTVADGDGGGELVDEKSVPFFSPVTGQCCNRGPGSLGTRGHAGTGTGHRWQLGSLCAMGSFLAQSLQQFGPLTTGEAVLRVEVWGASP